MSNLFQLTSKLRLVTNKLGSTSAKLLAQALSEKLSYKVYRAKSPKINRKNLVYGDCKDKIFQYNWFKEQDLPALEFTTSIETAREWCANKGVVFARTLTRASEGKGIIIAETPDEVPVAPVFTLYKKKKKEFRVHVYKESVVSVLEKRKRKDFHEDRDTRIRNTANGYVFCSEDVVEPPGLRELAIKASRVTGSDFKGVDIGYNEKLNELFIIEVNSAPGIQGSNITKYVEAICADN